MQLIEIKGEKFYKIENCDAMRPFFMSIVSDSDHWMFISSNGGLSAGRKNANFALFPYYTDDKITEFADITGSKTILQVHRGSQVYLWEPFSDRFNEKYNFSRNLYKNSIGNKVIFEEIHHDFNLTFRYQWCNTDRYGFVKKSELINHSGENLKIAVVDGIQNLMPQGVSSDLQTTTSNLVDAYKRSEIETQSGIGIFALSAIIVDKAEPSEALKANIAWSMGIENPTYLLSSLQLPAFRKLEPIKGESDIKGEKGAYFVSTDLMLEKNSSKTWEIIANVNLDQSQVIALAHEIVNDRELQSKVYDDIALGSQNLVKLNGTSDGLQTTSDKRKDSRHFSNTLFNIMRGGVIDSNYQIEKKDLLSYLNKANRRVIEKFGEALAKLPDLLLYSELQEFAAKHNDVDLRRLCIEYLPLKFSRRHGDPSRPWNKFSINTRSEIDGSKILDYEGNWRDIFQNWEALSHAFPDFIDGMIYKFLNASTFDGYNPYRVTKDGFDWEVIEHDNPWSYIGYWGDHQIIYLLKFLEFIEKYQPGKLESYFESESFVYAAVPYSIKSYDEILKNPKDTISYNYDWEEKVNNQKNLIGADGALLLDDNCEILHVNFLEKILATVLSKMSNFIPEAGIWMNTQRPEWNDANNALVGNGVSMVTLCYLNRFLKFFQVILHDSKLENFKISNEMVEFYHAVRESLVAHRPLLAGKINDTQRREIMDVLGHAASEYRLHVYQSGFWGKKRTISIDGLKLFVEVSLEFINHTLIANKRADNLFHAYNLISVKGNQAEISYLPEMLEGQVAVLSSKNITGEEAVKLLDSLRKSSLYRADQDSYILYPNKALPKFLQKNCIPAERVQQSKLLSKLLQDQNRQIINQDVEGGYHFNGNFHNADYLKSALLMLQNHPDYSVLVREDLELVLQIFEDVFDHKSFTGRSGTFFAFEGLGSIYWHMVSKLHVAVQEVCLHAIDNHESEGIISALVQHYRQIGEGIGIHKTPQVYGAFPTDPYSHTPLHRGAQQPGMTGQVKEDILTRIGELGVRVENGKLRFDPVLLPKHEFLSEPEDVLLASVDGTLKALTIPSGSLAFTVCQVPVVYSMATENQVEIHFADGKVETYREKELGHQESQMIFSRTGQISHIKVAISGDKLR